MQSSHSYIHFRLIICFFSTRIGVLRPSHVMLLVLHYCSLKCFVIAALIEEVTVGMVVVSSLEAWVVGDSICKGSHQPLSLKITSSVHKEEVIK